MNNIFFKIKNFFISKIISRYAKRDNYFGIDYSEEQDIFIVGYPKSGNTWMQNLVAAMVYKVDAEHMPNSLAQEFVPDVHRKFIYKRFKDIAFFKSHHMPKEKYRRVIYIYRDGRDAMNSYYHMNQALGLNFTWEDMIIHNKGILHQWHEHVEAWLSNPYNAEIIYVKYEDLLAAPLIELKKIATFIGVEASDEELQSNIDGNSMASMKKKEKKFGLDYNAWKDDKKTFFRKGKTKDYLNHIPPELIQHMEEKYKDTLSKMGYE